MPPLKFRSGYATDLVLRRTKAAVQKRFTGQIVPMISNLPNVSLSIASVTIDRHGQNTACNVRFAFAFTFISY